MSAPLAEFCTPIAAGTTGPKPAAGVLSAARERRLREDLDALAAARYRVLLGASQ